ncbi:MAG TPA: YqaA family protein [Caulobacteraceae bacterium]|jgi:membrane protein YqaA with SNARE-associated domain
MLKGLYDRVMRLSGSPHAGWALFAVAFAESSFFPVPPDVMLAPMVLARPERTWRTAAICTAGSVCGGVLGYAIGYLLAPVGLWILAHAGLAGEEATFHTWLDRHGVLVILGLGLLPVPFKLVTISTGLLKFILWQFILATCVTRSARFFGVAFLVRRFGPTLLPVIERRLVLVASVVAGLAVLALVVLRMVHHHSA